MTSQQIIEYVRGEILPNLFLQEQGETMTNPYSGQSCFLEPEALALYEWIKGTDITLQSGMLTAAQEDVQVQKHHIICNYFRLNWPKEYSILID